MNNSQRSIQQEVNDLNESGTEELGRWIRLHVERVSAEIPDFVTKRRRRHVAPRAIEFTKERAREVIAILQEGLDKDLPGTIGITLYGREEL